MRTRKHCLKCGWTANWPKTCPKCGFFAYWRVFKSKSGQWFQLFKGEQRPIEMSATKGGNC